MKYIKNFENENIKYPVKYWHFLSKNHLKFAMKKIGMTDEEIEELYWILQTRAKNDFYIIYQYNDLYGKYTWSWDNTDPKNFMPINKKLKVYYILKFMGDIDIQDYEVDSEKYNL